MDFHESPSDSRPPRISRTFLSILTDLYDVIVWMVSILSLLSYFFSNNLETVPSDPTTTGIIVTPMFHSYLFL